MQRHYLIRGYISMYVMPTRNIINIEFHVAVKWWLGMDTFNGSLCALCPNSALDPLGHHATTCKKGGDI